MSTVNNQTDIYVSPILEPNFSWQVGFNSLGAINSGVQFRTTVRPLTNFENVSRIPSPTVLYEETGILLNGTSNLGLWQFSFAKNSTISGGPVRNYQVVVEAHDQNGNTSAGNQIATQNENGWTAYPNGYDIVAVNNPQPSGIELSFNVPTQVSSTGAFIPVTGTFATTQYMGANGEIIIKFTSGTFTSGIVGGFLYTSATQFPKQDIFAPQGSYGASVEQTQFSFDITNPFIYSPHAAFNVRGAPYCFASVSFFDEIDQVLLNNGIDVSTGLYISNNTPIYNDGAAGSLTMGGVATFFTVQTTGYPSISGARWSGLVGSGSTEIARVSTDGILNVPANITTIFYMALGITGLYSGYGGGQGGGIGGNSTQNVTGRTPGGFGTGTVIAIGFDASNNIITKPITGLKVGDTVISYVFPVLTGTDTYYNPLIDNWQNANYSLTGLEFNSFYSGNLVSGTVSRVGLSTVSGYMVMTSAHITNNFNFSYEQPIFIASGNLTHTFFSGEFMNGATFWTGMLFPGGKLGILFELQSPILSSNFGSDPINMQFTSFNAINSTGLFTYVEVKPYNTFFVNNGSNNNLFGFLAHNSLFNY